MSYKRQQKDAQKLRNLAARYTRKYNTAKTFADRKQKQKDGYVKHKGNLGGYDDE